MVTEIRPAPVQRVGGDAGSRGRLAMLVPVAMLVLVAAAAVAGAGLRQVPLETVHPSTAPGVTAQRPLPAGVTAAGFPGVALGLPVRTGSELEAARAAGAIGRELVVVAGVLRSEPLPLSCPAVRLTLSRTFCHRLAALFPVWTDADLGPTASGPGSIIAGHLLPGSGIPPVLATGSELEPPPARSVPVVLAGRFDDPRAPACNTGREWCRDDFVVELAVWVEGVWMGAQVVRDPAIPEPPDPAAPTWAGAIAVPGQGRSRVILGQALLRPDLLTIIDPIAARSATNTRSPGVWYIRSIATVQAAEKPQVGWAVIEDSTGVVLGYSWAQP